MEKTCETNDSPKTFKEYIRSTAMIKSVLSIVIGGALGFLYYRFVGCNSGSCSITNDPLSSSIFGAIIGFFIINKPCKTC